MGRAFVFPGQGSQAVGMGKALNDAFTTARYFFEEVDEALGQHLSRLMFDGPEEQLRLTENAQPAIMAASLATLRVLEAEANLVLPEQARFVAGHSLGEYTALTAAGSLGAPDAARLVKLRGRAMQDAVPIGEGAMAALLGLDFAAVKALAEEASDGDEVCCPANDNAPGQVVVSGSKDAVQRVLDLAREKGAKRALMLAVSAPFHCPLMAPAAACMEEALAGIELARPSVPLVANVTAEAVSEPGDIRRLLVEQVTGLVRWRESVKYLRNQRIDTLIELGAGKVLSGLTRRIDGDMTALNAGTPEEVEALLAAL
jgi:[acyl-carrier-protein] S-malonyltransferase